MARSSGSLGKSHGVGRGTALPPAFSSTNLAAVHAYFRKPQKTGVRHLLRLMRNRMMGTPTTPALSAKR